MSSVISTNPFGLRASRLAVFSLFLLPLPLFGQEKSSARTDVYGDPLPEGAIARLGSSHWRHASRVTFVAFTNGGKEVVSTCGDGVFHVWDAASGKELRHFGEANTPDGIEIKPRRGFFNPQIQPIAVSKEGKLLAMATADGKIHIWDPAQGKELQSFAHEHIQFPGLTFTPDGKNLISRGTQDRQIRVWEADTGKMVKSFDECPDEDVNMRGRFGGGGANPIAVSPDGKYLAGGRMQFGNKAWTSVLQIWDLAEGKPFKAVEDGGLIGGWNNRSYIPVFTSDSKHVAYPRVDGGVQVIEVSSGKEIAKLGGQDPDQCVVGLVACADGKTLAALRLDQQINLFDVTSGKQLKTIGEELDGPQGKAMPRAVRQNMANFASAPLALSPDGKTLAQGWGNMVRLWNIETGKGNDVGSGHRGEVQSLVVSPDGKTVFSAAADATIRKWDLAGAKESQRIDLGSETSRSLIISAKQAVVQEGDAIVHAWDLSTGKKAVKLDTSGMATPIVMLAASADGKTVAASSPDCMVRLFSMQSGKEITTIRSLVSDNTNQATRRYLYALDVTPDGSAVAVQFQTNEMVPQPGGGFGYETHHSVRLYDVESGVQMWENTTAARCQGFQFSPDGHNLALINADGATTLVLEGITGKERARLEGNGIMPVFSDDGRFLALGGSKSEVKVFDVRTGKEIASFKGHEGRVPAIAFSPDATTLFTGAADGTTLVWDLHDAVRQAKKIVEVDAPTAKTLWTDLGDDDANKAYKAVGELSTSPARALDLAKDQVKPSKAEDAKRIEKLIAQLDDDNYDVRRKASESLAKFADQARPALVKVLKGPPEPSLELKTAATELLTLAAPSQVSTDLLRNLRSLEVLEAIGTPEARAVLEKIAKGAPGTRLTIQSEAALARMRK